MNKQQLKLELIRDEGKKSNPYPDSRGIITIGIGRNLEKGLSKDELLLLFKNGLTEEQINYLYENDINEVEHALDTNYHWWRTLPENRQRVLANMMFNMGLGTFGKFHKFLAMAQVNDDEAFDEALNSEWAKQVGERAKRLEQLWREK